MNKRWVRSIEYSFELFESEAPATTHGRHSFLHAVKKLTREVKTLGRERVLTWYKGKGSEMENTSFFRCT